MTTTATEPITHWNLDPDETSVEFTVKTFWGLHTVHGRFDRFTGTYDAGPDRTAIELTVEAASVDTGNKTRDKHLRADGFFAAAAHPHVHFASSSVNEADDGLLHVAGSLEAGGETASLEFPATFRLTGDALEIEATATVDRQELGMSGGPLGMIGRPVTLHVAARLGQEPSTDAPRSRSDRRSQQPDDRPSELQVLLARARRFWGPAPAPDHPLTREERLPMPSGVAEEVTRALKGLPGDTHLAD